MNSLRRINEEELNSSLLRRALTTGPISSTELDIGGPHRDVQIPGPSSSFVTVSQPSKLSKCGPFWTGNESRNCNCTSCNQTSSPPQSANIGDLRNNGSSSPQNYSLRGSSERISSDSNQVSPPEIILNVSEIIEKIIAKMFEAEQSSPEPRVKESPPLLKVKRALLKKNTARALPVRRRINKALLAGVRDLKPIAFPPPQQRLRNPDSFQNNENNDIDFTPHGRNCFETSPIGCMGRNYPFSFLNNGGSNEGGGNGGGDGPFAPFFHPSVMTQMVPIRPVFDRKDWFNVPKVSVYSGGQWVQGNMRCGLCGVWKATDFEMDCHRWDHPYERMRYLKMFHGPFVEYPPIPYECDWLPFMEKRIYDQLSFSRRHPQLRH